MEPILEMHFDAFEGWDADESRERRRQDGERVTSRLHVEVTAFADVQYESWPLESGKQSGTMIVDLPTISRSIQLIQAE